MDLARKTWRKGRKNTFQQALHPPPPAIILAISPPASLSFRSGASWLAIQDLLCPSHSSSRTGRTSQVQTSWRELPIGTGEGSAALGERRSWAALCSALGERRTRTALGSALGEGRMQSCGRGSRGRKWIDWGPTCERVSGRRGLSREGDRWRSSRISYLLVDS